eukprot:TRINITY_DN5581_c0_g1_i1.p1 TRINITY_DN5581_c0_g1~~TRINITY_DN5581_c0_g1_i1.p1  ORF type:complete len:538 (+),score=112.45 TRINITY_DN5581_c0_g1_i1:184-1797(+)
MEKTGGGALVTSCAVGAFGVAAYQCWASYKRSVAQADEQRQMACVGTEFMSWDCAEATLELWTESRLRAFHTHFLGDPDECCGEGTTMGDKLRDAARAVIKANQGRTQQPPRPSPIQTQSSVPHAISFASVSPNEMTPKDTSYPQVVLSYQSKQRDVMVQVRGWLNAKGIATVDGTQVLGGQDWRAFYFTALSRASVLVAMISHTSLLSKACEMEITAAVDEGKALLPVVADFKYEEVLRSPQRFLKEDSDTMLKAHMIKMGVILSQVNRIPGDPREGPVTERFEENMLKLLKSIKLNLPKEAKPKVKAFPWDGKPPQVALELELEHLRNSSSSAETQALKSLLDQMSYQLLPGLNEDGDGQGNANDPIPELCTTLIGKGAVEVLLQYMQHEKPRELKAAATQLLGMLCLPGGHFGNGLENVRRDAAEKGAINLLLGMLKSEFGLIASNGRSEEQKKGMLMENAVLCLNYITRSHEGKAIAGDEDAIRLLDEFLKETSNFQYTELTTIALGIMWNLVYMPKHKETCLLYTSPSPRDS